MTSTNTPTLHAEVRDTKGSSEARRVRRKGLVPAVCYGHGIDNVNIAIDPQEFDKLMEQPSELNTVFEVQLDDGETLEHLMLRDYQVDPVSRFLTHADLVAIDPSQPIRVRIPIETRGEAEGVKVGGRLQFIRRDVEVFAPPTDIPQSVSVDVSHLEPDDAIMANELEYPDNVEPAHKIDYAVIRIQMPREEIVTTVAPATTAAVTPTTEEEEGEAVEGEEEEAEGVDSGAEPPGA